MTGWEPIETAPHDDAVLLWSPDAREHGVMVGYHSDVGGPDDCEAWIDFWTDVAIDAWPTHWMPIPGVPIP